MKFNSLKLNFLQLQELAKVFLDIGKAIFLGSVVGYFIPTLVNKEVLLSTLIFGILSSLTFILIGITMLSKEVKK